tara:strand:- start:266 stop:988 length:723 start_codon:yes stop_codon:yes gene_type:complete
MSLSIIIPVHNESSQILTTLKSLIKIKGKVNKFEIIIIDDFSTDNTKNVIKKFSSKKKFIKIFNNKKKGLGSAISLGILKSMNKYIAIFMADMSDDPKDLLNYYSEINKKNLDAVFGTRFSNKSLVVDYPIFKLVLNRIFNYSVSLLFLSSYNDFTNAFKIYKKDTLVSLFPIVSENFNIFLELPLKIISRKYKYTIIPIKWRNRKKGVSKFRIRELGSMYVFTLIYCLLEKFLLNKKRV